jgi:hypothetical protein
MDVAARLREEATRGATGRLDIDAGELRARVWLRAGRLSALATSSNRHTLGMGLVSNGSVSLTTLGKAQQMQRQHPGMRLGDVLVRMGRVSPRTVESITWEQMCDDAATVMSWTHPAMTFTDLRPEDVAAGGPEVEEILKATADRREAWQRAVSRVGGPDTVPVLCSGANTAHASLRPAQWAVLCRVNGQRSLQVICDQAGLSTMEATAALEDLVTAGLVAVPNPVFPPPDPPAQPEPPPTAEVLDPAPAAATEVVFDDPAELLRELSQLSGTQRPSRRSVH